MPEAGGLQIDDGFRATFTPFGFGGVPLRATFFVTCAVAPMIFPACFVAFGFGGFPICFVFTLRVARTPLSLTEPGRPGAAVSYRRSPRCLAVPASRRTPLRPGFAPNAHCPRLSLTQSSGSANR